MTTTSSLDGDALSQLRAIPKIELHVHLEGSLTPEFSLSLAQRHNIDIGAGTESELKSLYEFKSFEHFLHLYGELTFLLAEPADFTSAVIAYGRQLHRDGAIYAEMTLTLGTHVHFKGLDPETVMAAAWKGAQEVEQETGIFIRFILDHVRSFSIERCHETIEWCHAFRRYGVVGFGLAGPEKDWPASRYTSALRELDRLAVPFVPHAGEADGPEAIWDVLRFNPARIGHGLTAVDDPKLVQALRDREIMVEVCATSNVVLHHAPSYKSHPVRRLWHHGIPISINTDDPPMFATSLLQEYVLLHDQLDFAVEELQAISARAVDHTLADEAVRRKLGSHFV